MQIGSDFVVIGAGVVGSAVAYGLLRRGHKVIVLDGSESDPRASAANFGLVWVQGKGPGVPAYQHLTRSASDLWPLFADELAANAASIEGDSSLPLTYERNGGLTFTFGAKGYEERSLALLRLHNESGGASLDHEMIDRKTIKELMPDFQLGEEVSGASFCWRDGCVNPLALHMALWRAITRLGGEIRLGWTVNGVSQIGSDWRLTTRFGHLFGGHVILAAGLGSAALAERFGVDVPIRPQRGQVLVSQRMPRIMPLPASTLRQTSDGTFMVGATKEEVGFDRSTTVEAAADLARHATRIMPALRQINVVRQWAGLRVMTPDGAPIYDFGDNATAVSCHSGITLAPIHSDLIVSKLLGEATDHDLEALSPARFGKRIKSGSSVTNAGSTNKTDGSTPQ